MSLMIPKSPFRQQHAQQALRRPVFEPGDKADFSETKTVLRELRDLMDPNEDIAAISEAELWLLKQEESKTEAVERLQAELRALNQTLHEAFTHALRPPTAPTQIEHEQILHRLEDAHVSVGKQVNHESGEVAKKEGELIRLKEEREEWVGRDVGRNWAGEREGRDRGRALKINMIHETGFSLNATKDTVLIRNERNVHSFRIDDDKPKSFTTNMLWQLASE